MDKDNKDFIDKLNSLKTQLEQEKEASTIKELLSNLYKIPFPRALLVKSKIIQTIRALSDKFKSDADIKKSIVELLKTWKGISEDNNKEKKTTTISKELQLNEGTMNVKLISMISASMQKAETDPIRRNTKKLLFEFIAKSKKTKEIYMKNKSKEGTEEQYLTKIKGIAIKIEEKMKLEYILSRNLTKYKQHTKSLISNLSKNDELVSKILLGELPPEKVATMDPTEMMSKEEQEKIKKKKEELFDSRRSDWNMVHGDINVSGQYKCGKCKSNRTTYTQIQIRRADEPMTTFVTCLNCGNGWKC